MGSDRPVARREERGGVRTRSVENKRLEETKAIPKQTRQVKAGTPSAAYPCFLLELQFCNREKQQA